MPFIAHKSASVYYQDKGSSNEHAIVFVHGNSCSSRTWQSVFESDLSNKYQLIAFDLPGHGKSDDAKNPNEAYTVQGLVDCVVFVATTLKLYSFLLVGHSLGGHLVIESVNRLAGCKGIMIMGTPPVRPPLPHDMFLGQPQILAYNFTGTLTTEQAKILARSRAKTIDDVNPLVEDILRTDTLFREILITTVNGPLGADDEIEAIENLEIPVAILHGDVSEIANIAYINRLRIPKLWMNKIHTVRSSGHTIPMEQPKLFVELLKKFSKHAFCEE